MTAKRLTHVSDIILLKKTFLVNKSDELIIIWFDETIDPEIRQTLKELHTHTDTCSSIEQLTDLINSLSDYKIMLIITGKYSDEVLTQFHHNEQIDSIFIFCINKQSYQHFLDEKTHVKLIGIYTDYKPLFQSIEKRMRRLLQHLSIFRIIELSNKSIRDLEQESAYYAWYQLLRDSLIHIEPEASKKEMLEYCRSYYANDPISLKQVNDFEQKYHVSEVIRWYTNNYFPFNFINKALRSEDVDALYNLRYFIISLSKELKKLYDENISDMQMVFEPYLKVYRGLTLSNDDIDRLKTFVNRYVSTNGFLSTTLSRDVAQTFATNVLFEIVVDPKEISPNLTYAYIAPFSQVPDEEEVLFDLGATFHITEISSDGDLCIVSMIATTNLGCTKNIYTDTERELLRQTTNEIDSNFRSILTFGMYLMHMGQYDKSITFLRNLLYRTRLYEYERYFVLKALARAHMNHNDQDLALQYALEAYQIKKFICPNEMQDIELLRGRIYNHREEHDLALQCYQRVLGEGNIDDPDTILEIHTNMALSYFLNNDLIDAFEHQQILLHMLHDLDSFDPVTKSDAYITIAEGYALAKNFPSAIEYGEKALSIRMAIFPDNHPILPLTYNELADFYDENSEYDTAIQNYRKSMDLYEKFTSKYVDSLEMQTIVLSNIARCYGLMQQFDLARLNFERALEIQQRIIPYDEMKLAQFHEKIAVCDWGMKNYDLTILQYQMAFELRKKISANSAEIVQLYKQIGTCYDEKHKHELARKNYQKAVELQKELTQSNDVLVADIYILIASSYEIEKNYSSSMDYYRLSLAVRDQCDANNPETIRLYKIIAKLYAEIYEYDFAVENLKKALEIHEMSDPDAELTSCDLHTRLASYYKQSNNENQAIRHLEYAINIYEHLQDRNYDVFFSLYEQLSTLYWKQSDSSSALQVYERMVEILENFKLNDPLRVANFYSQISETYCKLDRYNIALNYCKKSIEIAESHCRNEYNLLAKNNEIFGRIYYQDRILSENYYRKALGFFQTANADEDVQRIEKIVQEICNSAQGISTNERNHRKSSFHYRTMIVLLFVLVVIIFTVSSKVYV